MIPSFQERLQAGKKPAKLETDRNRGFTRFLHRKSAFLVTR
jgi:hypothetical protein